MTKVPIEQDTWVMNIWAWMCWIGRQPAIPLVGGCSIRLSKAAIELVKGSGNYEPAITDLI